MTKQNHISRVWDIVEKAPVGMLTTRFAGGLRARPLEARADRDAGIIWFVTDVRGAKDDEIDAAQAVLRHPIAERKGLRKKSEVAGPV